VNAALDALAGADRETLRRLAKALARSAAADGRIDDIEAEFIADLTTSGAPQHGFGWHE
jgi:uncharacterized membrane protein YebE (DUF533 family)